MSEKNRIAKWAKKNSSVSQLFHEELPSTRLSYFDDADYDNYVTPYGMDDLPQFKEELSHIWHDMPEADKLSLTVAVGAFKAKSSVTNLDVRSKKMKESEELPEYLYVF